MVDSFDVKAEKQKTEKPVVKTAPKVPTEGDAQKPASDDAKPEVNEKPVDEVKKIVKKVKNEVNVTPEEKTKTNE